MNLISERTYWFIIAPIRVLNRIEPATDAGCYFGNGQFIGNKSCNMNKHNEYSKAVSMEFFDQCPKTVFAALAVSHVLNLKGCDFADTEKELLNEWISLYENGIIKQRPVKINGL